MKSVKPIVIFLGNRQGYFSREVLRGILLMHSKGCDWQIWAMPVIHDKRQLEACIEEGNIVGVIARGLDAEFQRFLQEREIPLVAIRGSRTKDDDVSNGPHADDESIGEKAGREFQGLNLGYWGFVHWEGLAWSEARRQSFQAYAESQGAINKTLSLNACERNSWDGVMRTMEWVKSLSKPCGVLACNDEAGMDVLHACQLAGLDIPDHVAVIGVDNDRLLCESTIPPLSSIDLYAVDVGKAAARQLCNLLEGRSGEEPYMEQAELIVRESSHQVDRYLLIYQKSVDFIAAHAATGISVAKVASGCGVSRRGLERAFEKYSNETPAGAIRKQRLTAIIRLLKNQSLNLDHLAQQVGFSDSAGLSNFVKRMTGKPPGDFR